MLKLIIALIIFTKFKDINAKRSLEKSFEPNIILNLKTITSNGSAHIGEYLISALVNSSKLPFDLDMHLKLSFYDKDLQDCRIILEEKHPKGKTWNISMNMHYSQFNIIQLGFRCALYFEFDAVLSEVFKCRFSQEGYVGYFYFYNKINKDGFIPIKNHRNVSLSFAKRIDIFFLVGLKNSSGFDNEKNYEKFMGDCSSFPSFWILVILVFGCTVLIMVLLKFYHHLSYNHVCFRERNTNAVEEINLPTVRMVTAASNRNCNSNSFCSNYI